MRVTKALCLALLLVLSAQLAHASWSKVKVADGPIVRYRLHDCGGNSLGATGVLAPDNGVLHAASTDLGSTWQATFLPKPRWVYDLLHAGSLWLPPSKALVHARVFPATVDLIPVFHYRGDGTYDRGTINGATVKPSERQVWRLLRGDATGDILYAVMSETAQANAAPTWWLARSGDGGKQWYYVGVHPAIPATSIMVGDTTPGYSQWLVTDYHLVRVDPGGYMKVVSKFPNCEYVVALSAPNDTDVFVLWTQKPTAAKTDYYVSYSADGGDTWTHRQQMLDLIVEKWTTGDVSMDFLDPSFGVIVANSKDGCMVHYTKTAGDTWTQGDLLNFRTEGGVQVTDRGKAVFLGTDSREGNIPKALWKLLWSCDEALPAPAPVTFAPAFRPVLSYVGSGAYRDAGVSPTHGTPADEFHFRVRVVPPMGNTIQQVHVWLEGPQGSMGNHQLTRESQDADGEIWGATYPRNRFQAGETYRYYFECVVEGSTYIR